MSRIVRRFDRTIAIRRAKKQIERDIKLVTLRSFRRGWRELFPTLRRLRKQETDEDWWLDWEDDFNAEFEAVLLDAVNQLAGIDQRWYAGFGYNISYDPRWILHNHQTGEKITRIPRNTKERVRRMINEWYATDLGVGDLAAQLESEFNEQRAMLIAVNETTMINSSVTSEMMMAGGFSQWDWWTMLDDYVCQLCRPLQGRRFNLLDPMPPDGSHIGCRCSPAPVIPSD